MTCTEADKNGCTMAKGGDDKETKAAPGAKVGDADLRREGTHEEDDAVGPHDCPEGVPASHARRLVIGW
jgi:hypothetical protein